jgi:hypothetical protein
MVIVAVVAVREALASEKERPISYALARAWDVVREVFTERTRVHGLFDDTIADVLQAAEATIRRVEEHRDDGGLGAAGVSARPTGGLRTVLVRGGRDPRSRRSRGGTPDPCGDMASAASFASGGVARVDGA